MFCTYELSQWFPDYDHQYRVIFHASWADWEDAGWCFIFERDGQYYSLEDNHYAAACSVDPPTTFADLMPISAEEALDLMLEWESSE